jgi:hypothetical protein
MPVHSEPDPKPADTTDEPAPVEPRDDDVGETGEAETTSVTITGDDLVVTEDDGEP